MAKEQAIKEPNAVVRYYRETVGEPKKVVWPTREEALRLTWIVLVVSRSWPPVLVQCRLPVLAAVPLPDRSVASASRVLIGGALKDE